jgi:subtilisin family serine protease
MTGYVNRAGLAKLEADPDVRSVGPDVGGQAFLDHSVPFINADDVHNLGYTGKGITVAVLDSGIDSDHRDLSDNIAPGWYHFLEKWQNNQWVADYGPGAEDECGHGTNVSGIITSKGMIAPVGVAPDADILAIKVLDVNCEFRDTSDVVAGVDYVIDHQSDYENLCIINMSLGTNASFTECPCDSNGLTWVQNFKQALDTAKDSGFVIFAASGNSGYTTKMPVPACLSAATAVAAVYDQNSNREPADHNYFYYYGDSFPTRYDAPAYGDLITCFSNRNGCNELAAPGRSIWSTGMGGFTSTYTGTSQASPHCAGVAALMYEKAASLGISISPDQIVQIMKDTGVATTDPCGTSPNPKRVDALAAVNAVPPYHDIVVCEPRGGVNPAHPTTYWYDVTPDGSGRCDFHVQVFDPHPANYTNPTLPFPNWQFAVHKVGSQWWASWWDPNCTDAIFDTFRFQFEHPNPSRWGEWTTTIGGNWNPYDGSVYDGNVADNSTAHADEPDGYGYRVHVPRGRYIITWSTIDGGGRQSSGGQYKLTGTIGQPDAGYSAGGSHELLGGFWPGGSLCFVDFPDFARFAEYWLEIGGNLPADLDGNGIVNMNDLKLFVDVWLCLCPYNWPLR